MWLDRTHIIPGGPSRRHPLAVQTAYQAASTSSQSSHALRKLIFRCATYHGVPIGATFAGYTVNVRHWRGSKTGPVFVSVRETECDLKIVVPDKLWTQNILVRLAEEVWSADQAPENRIPPNALMELCGAVEFLVVVKGLGQRPQSKSTYPWALDAFVRIRPVPTLKGRLTGGAYHAAELERAQRLLGQWTARLRFAQKKVKKYDKKVRHHERKLAEPSS